jgi:hypothetical protein
METPDVTGTSAVLVSYEEAPLVQLEHQSLDYRVDPVRGSQVAISQRPVGTWDWSFLLEGRWDGSRLRARGLGAELVSLLEARLKVAAREGLE